MTTPPLADWIAHRAHASPSHPALEFDGRVWTFAEFNDEVARATRRLAGLGVRVGDRVAVLLHNGPAIPVLLFAAPRLGACVAPLNVRLTPGEIATQLGELAPAVLVVEARTAATASAALAALGDSAGPLMVTIDRAEGGARGWQECAEAPVQPRLRHPPDSVFAVINTSGTTGRHKGAQLTIGNFWWNAIGSALNLGMQVDDRWLACLPLHHVGGLAILTRAAIHGITAVVHDGFDADRVNRALDGERVTLVSVVAVMLQRMLDARGDRPYPPSLRCVLLGGGPAPAPLLQRCARIGVPVVQTYGLTETASQVATLAPADAAMHVGASGRALYPNEIRIRAAADDAARDGTGEILVRGPVVMAGYFGQPQATARAIVDGWLHTGDIGRLDDEGFLYVLDRRDDMIISGGENVYPAEVEDVLLAHAWVDEVAVIGQPDATWGQRVVAVIRLGAQVPGTPADVAAALRSHCAARLARYKVPSEFRMTRDPLPRTASGKLRRAAVRDQQP